jgi:hypothetical protein
MRKLIDANPDLIRKAFRPAWWQQLLIALREKRPPIRRPTRHQIRRGGTWRWR